MATPTVSAPDEAQPRLSVPENMEFNAKPGEDLDRTDISNSAEEAISATEPPKAYLQGSRLWLAGFG